MRGAAMTAFIVAGVLGVFFVWRAGISADRQQDALQRKLDKIEPVANDVSKIKEMMLLGKQGHVTRVAATSSAQLPPSQSDHHPSVKVNGQPVGGKPLATAACGARL